MPQSLKGKVFQLERKIMYEVQAFFSVEIKMDRITVRCITSNGYHFSVFFKNRFLIKNVSFTAFLINYWGHSEQSCWSN